MALPARSADDSTTRSAHARGVGTLLVAWDGGSFQLDVRPGIQLTVGRGAEVDVRVPHASVSRRHVALVFVEHGVEARDLGSHNGTVVRGRRLSVGESTRVGPDESIRIGEVSLVWRADRAPTAPPAKGSLDVMHQTADLVARGRLSVLIAGESGAGKEVLASRIHATSPRASASFVRVNCAALPEPLLEAELFGYERGAFTGAVGTKPGLIEGADRGTLLLDEVGDLPLATQAKLLRVLESREVTRLGSVKPRLVDVRFLAATNRDLQAMIAEGTFRADLYYRLNGITLTVPPLRERAHEIDALTRSFIRATCKELGREAVEISGAAASLLHDHSWPGNVRELKNAIECAVLVCGDGPIEPSHLALAARRSSGAPPTSLAEELEALERRRIEDSLTRCSGNQTRAAKELGIPRHVLVARITAWGLPRPRKV